MAPTGSAGVAGARPDRLRTHAIDLYCRELCGSTGMSAAAHDAVDSVSPADAWGGDDALLRVTRTSAARHAPTKAAPRGWRGMLAAEHESECDRTPSLLAQRANGELPPARQTRLEEHLGRCLFCRAVELREHRATRAFSAVIVTGDPRARRPRITVPVEPAVSEAAPAPPDAVAEPPEPAAPPRRGLVMFPATATSPAAPAVRQRVAAPAARGRSGGRGRARGAVTAYLPFLATLAVGAVLVTVVALLFGGGAQARNAAASLPPPSAASTPPPSVGIAATQNTPKPQAHTTGTHPGTTTTPTTTSTTPSAIQTTAAAAPANPVPTNTPAANPTPAPRQPAKPTPTPTTSSPPPVVVTQQGTGLPAATAPTQTIASGGTSTTH